MRANDHVNRCIGAKFGARVVLIITAMQTVTYTGERQLRQCSMVM